MTLMLSHAFCEQHCALEASILIMRTPETELALIAHDPIQSRIESRIQSYQIIQGIVSFRILPDCGDKQFQLYLPALDTPFIDG